MGTSGSKCLAKKILLIDDDADLLRSLHRRLELRGYHVLSTSDGATACRWLASPTQEIGFVLLDWSCCTAGVPVRQELLTCKQQCALTVPIYAMTGHGMDKVSMQDCQKGELDGLFSKPIHLDDLLATLQTFGIVPSAP